MVAGCAQAALVGGASEGSSQERCSFGWRVSPSPKVAGFSHLNGVATVSRSDVWAVGIRAGVDNDVGGPTLAEHWNGKRWTVVGSPSVEKSDLLAVSAAGPNDVWAVGFQRAIPDSNRGRYPLANARALVERWKGSSWQTVPIAAPNGSVLYGVAALSARDVWAVGASRAGTNAEKALVAHWGGRRWQLISTPRVTSSSGSVLFDVAALSTRDVWAVGSATAYAQPDEAMAMHWNGRGWRATLLPVDESELTALATISPKHILAVGSHGLGSSEQGLFEQWDGKSWRIAPNDHYFYDPLSSVVAAAADDAWAVGGYIDHWDGAQWTYRPTPDLTLDEDWFSDVAVVARDEAWAVGVQATAQDGSSGGDARIEHYGCA